MDGNRQRRSCGLELTDFFALPVGGEDVELADEGTFRLCKRSDISSDCSALAFLRVDKDDSQPSLETSTAAGTRHG